MGKIYEEKNAQALTRLLRRINQGVDPKLLKREANRLLPNITPKDIATAEQNLIDNGFSAQLAENLATAFMLMGVLEDERHIVDLRKILSDTHILRIVLAEHEILRCFLADLQEVTEKIEQKEDFNDTCTEYRKLTHLIEHLDAMEEHIAREEDIIFPYLKKHGWKTVCRTARSDHIYIRIALNDLVRLIGSFNPSNCKDFKFRLSSITKYLVPTMTEHLFQEENVLFPIALEVIKDKSVWDSIKELCDELGYCGVHL